MVTYTTAAIVRKRVEDIDSNLSDSDIEQFITDAEGIIDATMQHSFIATFDATKHKILRNIATDLAAFYCIAFQTSNFASAQRAALAADMLWETAKRGLELLKDKRTVEYLKSL